MHARLGHLPINHIATATTYEMWENNIKVQLARDPHCLACKIRSIRSSRRGRRLLTSAPGQKLHLDVVYNNAPKGLTIKDNYRYYLGVTDAFSCAYFLIGMMGASVNSLKSALRYYSEYYKPSADYSLLNLEVVHADASMIFDSAPFKEWCKQEGQKASVVLAAPHRPEQNGLTENRWQQVQRQHCKVG
jgi:transposase InsO family protein